MRLSKSNVSILATGLFLAFWVVACGGPTTPQEVTKEKPPVTVKEKVAEKPATPDAGPAPEKVAERKICQPGTASCRCTPTGACFKGLRCEDNICQVCTPGTAGCACKTGNKCSEGLKCSNGTCQGCVGKDKCPCFGNNSCSKGNKCVVSDNSVSVCKACSKDNTEDCNCESDADCGKLACVNMRCMDLKKVNQIPKNPSCYTPCQADVKASDGTIRVCHPQYHLADNCGPGQNCVEGSCVKTGDKLIASKYPFCNDSADCPNWQTCLSGRCYSTCRSSSDCASGFKCHSYVCRRKCNVRKSECGAKESCLTSGSDDGICMPKSTRYNPAPPQTKTPGTFKIPVHNIEFTNTAPTQEFAIINKSSFAATFTITRARDSISPKNPLSWLKLDLCKTYANEGRECKTFANKPTAAEPFVIKDVPPKAMRIIRITNAGGKPKDKSAYYGTLQIKHSQMGAQEVLVKYRELGDGQWRGTMVSFGNFNDINIEKFPASSSLPLRDVPNALLRRWINFKRNGISFDKFRALLRSVREGSWRLPKVAKDCKVAYSTQASEDVVCYPYSSSKGYEILSYSQREASVPSGISELNFTVNVKEKSGNIMEGRIDTGRTLQYPGNPFVQFVFDAKPGSKALTLLKKFEAIIDIGGRNYVSDKDSCTDPTKYQKVTVPWMVPGFEAMTYPRAGSLFRDRFECRTKTLPKSPPAGASKKQREEVEQYNLSLAASNPIPNGWRLRRKLELVDGALIQNRFLFILYRERFVSFFNTATSKKNALSSDFYNYGYILMERSPFELDPKDYTGSRPVAQKTCATTSQCTGKQTCNGGVCRNPSALNQVTCSPDIVRKAINRSLTGSSDLERWGSQNLDNLVSALILGQTPQIAQNKNMLIDRTDRGNGFYEYSYSNTKTKKQHFIHYLCEDTKQFNGGPKDNPVDCPASSKVIFFELQGVTEEKMRNDLCQKGKTCDARLAQFTTSPGFRKNVPFKCKDNNAVFCDSNRKDLREGKIFFRPATGNAYVTPFEPLRIALFNAFRYRLKFQSRSGKNIGFTPSMCNSNASSLTPYCYEPKIIEEIEKRVNCLEYIFANGATSSRLSKTVKGYLKNFLKHAFSYSNRKLGGVILTDFGFETLNAELKIMLADEAFTKSFSSRYDLANSNLVSFQGSLLEPNGIDLSGALGFEMYNLYLSVQYYQLVLDRFFAQADVIHKSFQSQDTAFVSSESVTSYFQKLLLASTRKARSLSQIAKRYHQLDRADLARSVIEKSYAATFMEMTVLTRLLRELVRIIDPKKIPQISSEIDKVALIYKSSLLDMEETYKKLSLSMNNFGLPEGYIPFPAMDSFSALSNSNNAFTVSLRFAKEKMFIARNKEQGALNSKRNFDTNAASFQNELVRIERNYENQLIEICGGIKVKDNNGVERIYPAVPRYAMLSESTRKMGNPCGLVPGGALFNAIAELEKMRINLLSLKKTQDNLRTQITLEKERIKKYCDSKFELAKITWDYRGKQNNLQLEIEDTQKNIDRTIRIGQTLSQMAEMVKCSIVVGLANGGDCPMAIVAAGLIGGIGAIQETVVGVLEGKLRDKRVEQMSLERQLEKTQLQFECRACNVADKSCDKTKTGTAQFESNIKIKEITASIMNLNYEALKAQYDLKIASSNIIRLRQQARRLITQQDETTQMAINVRAAQSDPNVRIYKNDAIISAERTFEDAMREAYRTTLIYEYYTGQTYKRKGNLYLIRMISYGDKNLETYLSRLEQAFREFEEKNGKPDPRVVVLSLRDDILKVARSNPDKTPRTLTDRVAEFQKALADRNRLNEEGFTSFPFNLSVAKTNSSVSPITFNHKVLYIEAEIIGGEIGDSVGRVYIRQKGTGVVRLQGNDTKFHALPQRTAVVNPYFNGTKVFTPEIYRNFRLRDRPLGNTQWEVLINQVSEKANQDINLNSVNDVRIYIYYTDFTEEN